jgi:hypothetical protein
MAATLIDFYINVFAISVRQLKLWLLCNISHEIDAVYKLFLVDPQLNQVRYFVGIVGGSNISNEVQR